MNPLSDNFAAQTAKAYYRQFSSNLELSHWQAKPAHARPEITWSRQIGEIYEAAPALNFGVSTIAAYTQFSEEIDLQYQWLKSKGFTFNHQAIDPYRDSSSPSKAMIDDINNNLYLTVYKGGNLHPLLNNQSPDKLSLNDKFRAIHDVFGHAIDECSFGPVGEERAWLSHARLFSPLAIQALTTETRGQNSWFNYGPHLFDDMGWKGSSNHPRFIPPQDRPYPLQKVFLLPPRFFDPFLPQP